jgi:LemA protein
MKGQSNLFLIIFLIIALAAVSIVLILNYNGLIKTEKAVHEAKAQIETVCQRRLDLIPNVIEAVKGYAKHEQQTLLAITQARTQAMGVLDEIGQKEDLTKETIVKLESSQTELTKALKSVFALIENYPDLKASMNFLALQDQFEGTENRIAVARQRYNMAVRTYNSKIETFPGVFLAPIFGFGEKEFYEAKAEAMDPVRAEF